MREGLSRSIKKRLLRKSKMFNEENNLSLEHKEYHRCLKELKNLEIYYLKVLKYMHL